MAQKDNKSIEQDIAEAILEIPITFTVGRKRITLHPKTLGQELMMRPYRDRIGIDTSNLQANPLAEALRIAANHTEDTARLVAIATLHGRNEVTDHRKIESRTRLLQREATTEDLATLLVMILEGEAKVDAFMRHAELDKERENIRKVNEVKASRHTFTFCGKTIWGQLIGTACERFGWTLDYVLWGISLTNLQMIIIDQPVTMTLSDEERRRVSLANVHDGIRVDDPENADMVRQLINKINQ